MTTAVRRPCGFCGLVMEDDVACTVLTYSDFPDGVERARIPNGDHRCHDCAAPADGLHHPGCDSERCPDCGGQAISCECTYEDEDDPI